VKKLVCYIKGLAGFERRHSNGYPLDSWNLLSCHPTDSITWHWIFVWNSPKSGYFRWWTLGLSFYHQRLMRREGKGEKNER